MIEIEIHPKISNLNENTQHDRGFNNLGYVAPIGLFDFF